MHVSTSGNGFWRDRPVRYLYSGVFSTGPNLQIQRIVESVVFKWSSYHGTYIVQVLDTLVLLRMTVPGRVNSSHCIMLHAYMHDATLFFAVLALARQVPLEALVDRHY